MGDVDADLNGVVLAGRYRLGRPLGAGGMARVFEARDERLERWVAIKLVALEGMAAADRRRFLAEARAGASFAHPHAVAVYDVGADADAGWVYLVMEVIDGPTLADVVADHGAFEPAEAVAIVTGLLDALAAAHVAGLVHRDVKPGNVLLGSDGAIKLADFGIAKRLGHGSDDLTAAGQFVGTPRYLAPEQLVGEPATPASDVYGVGVVLFELLTGRPPFDGDHPIAIALAHRDRPVPPMGAAVSPSLVAVVSRAMAKRPEDRYPDASVMATALADADLTAAPKRASADTGQATRAYPAREEIGSAVIESTQVAPTTSRPARRQSRARQRWIAFAVAVVAAVIVAVLLRTLASRGEDSAADSPVGTDVSATAALLPPVAPSSVADLIAALTVAGEGWGDAGPEMLVALQNLEVANGNEARDQAAALAEQVERWDTDGRLNSTFAGQALVILIPLGENPGNGTATATGTATGTGTGTGTGADTRPIGPITADRAVDSALIADVVQWQNISFPS